MDLYMFLMTYLKIKNIILPQPLWLPFNAFSVLYDWISGITLMPAQTPNSCLFSETLILPCRGHSHISQHSLYIYQYQLGRCRWGLLTLFWHQNCCPRKFGSFYLACEPNEPYKIGGKRIKLLSVNKRLPTSSSKMGTLLLEVNPPFI